MNMEVKEAFVFMGLTSDCTAEQEQMAYLKLSKKYHPDMAGGSAALFQMLKYYHDLCKKHFEELQAEESGTPINEAPINDNAMWIVSALGVLERLNTFEQIQGLTYGQKKLLREAQRLVDLYRNK